MKLQFDTQQARPAVEFVAGVINQRTTLPVLKHVHVKTDAHGIEFTASDLDVVLSARCAGSGDGETVIPGRALLGALRLATFPIEIEVVKDKATLTSGIDVLKFSVLPKDEFPPSPRGNGAGGFTVPAKELAEALEFVSHMQCVDESRHSFCGVLLEWGDGILNVVATDARRLGYTAIRLFESASGRMTVPSKAVVHLSRLCAKAVEVKVEQLSEELARFSAGEFSMIAKIIAVSYPNWRGILVKEEHVKARYLVSTDSIARAVDWSLLATSPKVAGVRFTSVKHGMEASMGNHDGTTAKTQLPAKCVSAGDAIATILNSDYALRLCKAFGDVELTWNYSAPLEPSWFTDGKRHLVLMPMQEP